MNHFPLRSLNILLIGLLLLTAACRNDTDIRTTGTSANPAFVGPRWQMTAFVLNPAIDFNGDGTLESDLFSFMPACDRDNSLAFNANGTMVTSRGQLQCSDSASNSDRINTWQYDSASRTLTITDSGKSTEPATWTVIEASASVLIIEKTDLEKGKPVKNTVHWKAI
ncbi:lipocalin family protein [Spirosoma spitsbergense]|uniref:lipocalin family protein n=1 Tax=Spirosoma spitsbergense TaxID=431554 RepID=UPI0003657BAB|nr:lipocalin family protein [Spirosoma spitsbergense]